jgi:hypothetical protein
LDLAGWPALPGGWWLCAVGRPTQKPPYYNELQSRSAEVEAMEMNFEQGVAGAVKKARLRARPGPKKKQNTKGIQLAVVKQTTASGLLEVFPSKTQLQKWRRRGVARKTKKIIYQRQWS